MLFIQLLYVYSLFEVQIYEPIFNFNSLFITVIIWVIQTWSWYVAYQKH